MQKTSTNKDLFRRLAIRLFIFIMIIILIIYGLPVFIQLLYPFILAFIVATIVNPLVNRVNDWLSRLNIDSKSSRNFITFVLTILILSIITFFVYFVFSKLTREVVGLANNIQNNWPEIVMDFEKLQTWITVQMDILPAQAIEVLESFTENILEFIQNFSRNLLNITVSTTSLVISRTGTFFLNVLTFFLSLYFMISDYNNIKSFIKNRMDKQLLSTVRLLKDSTLVAVGGYVKTQFILAFIAFVFMLITFIIYGQEYALTIAILLAIVDLIPLLGTIAVLAPWGVVEYIIGDPSKGIFLVLLGIGFSSFGELRNLKLWGLKQVYILFLL